MTALRESNQSQQSVILDKEGNLAQGRKSSLNPIKKHPSN